MGMLKDPNHCRAELSKRVDFDPFIMFAYFFLSSYNYFSDNLANIFAVKSFVALLNRFSRQTKNTACLQVRWLLAIAPSKESVQRIH